MHSIEVTGGLTCKPSNLAMNVTHISCRDVARFHTITCHLCGCNTGRFGMGRFTTTRDIDYTVERIVTQVTRLREMSPLWEMHQEVCGMEFCGNVDILTRKRSDNFLLFLHSSRASLMHTHHHCLRHRSACLVLGFHMLELPFSSKSMI